MKNHIFEDVISSESWKSSWLFEKNSRLNFYVKIEMIKFEFLC